MALTKCAKCHREWQANSGAEPCPFCASSSHAAEVARLTEEVTYWKAHAEHMQMGQELDAATCRKMKLERDAAVARAEGAEAVLSEIVRMCELDPPLTKWLLEDIVEIGNNVLSGGNISFIDRAKSLESALQDFYNLNLRGIFSVPDEHYAVVTNAAVLLYGPDAPPAHSSGPTSTSPTSLSKMKNAERVQRLESIMRSLVQHLELCRDIDFPGGTEEDRAVLASVNAVIDEARAALAEA